MKCREERCKGEGGAFSEIFKFCQAEFPGYLLRLCYIEDVELEGTDPALKHPVAVNDPYRGWDARGRVMRAQSTKHLRAQLGAVISTHLGGQWPGVGFQRKWCLNQIFQRIRCSDTCVCMAKPLCSSPETITTLLIDYTPIQNKKLKKKKRCNEIKVSQTGANKQTKQERVVDWGRRKQNKITT